MVDNKHGFRVDFRYIHITYYTKATWHVGPTHGPVVVVFVVQVIIAVVFIVVVLIVNFFAGIL